MRTPLNVLLVSLMLSFAAAADCMAEEVRPVFSEPLPGIAGKLFSVVEVDFAPGAKADPHTHGSAYVYAYVLSGRVRSQLAGQPAKVYEAGQSWSEPPGAIHVLTENADGQKPARLLVTFVADAGTPLKSPVSAAGAAAPASKP